MGSITESNSPLNTLEYTALQISDITIELPDTSSKWVQSINIRIDDNAVTARLEPKTSAGTARRLTAILEPPQVVVLSLQLTALLRYKSVIKKYWRSEEITVSPREFKVVQNLGSSPKKEWRGVYGKNGKITVIVGLTMSKIPPHQRPQSITSASSIRHTVSGDSRTLTPTTDDILRNCPRFRVLVMGKTGVGKSRLINEAFGVTDAIESHTDAGHADIDQEILSKDNPHFVLHDSKGFEHGDDTNVKTVQRFINQRSNMPLVKDKLHAVWLCIDIPATGGRLLETGIEQFLKLKIEGKLGNVPVIVVFTKYDLLIIREDRMLKPALRKGLTREGATKLIEKHANDVLQTTCIDPFEKWCDKQVPHVTVSTKPGYEPSLVDLVDLTYNHVRDHFADASVVSAIAQRVSPRSKIQASIAVGRKKYWERLASSVNFTGKTLQQCLDVIHADIIAVWRFDDPYGYLSSVNFKALMSNITADDLEVDKLTSGRKTSLAAGVSLIAGVAGIVSALSGPASPIVIPIAAGFVLAKWAFDVYKMTRAVLRRLMTYIIDLTLVLQNAFWLHSLANEGRPLSRRLIKTAARAYHESNMKQTLRFEVDKHLQSVSFGVGPDATLRTIIRLIEAHTIDSAEMFEQRGGLILPEGVGLGEGWEKEVDEP